MIYTAKGEDTMIIYAAVDDHMGMTFNHRRQSQDKMVREMILNETKTGRLWLNLYTKKQFDDPAAEQIIVDENFLEKAAEEDYCFVENCSLKQYEDKITKIILIRWGRSYPADTYFDIDLTDGRWKLLTSTEFEGNSHKNITREEWVNEKEHENKIF